MARFNNFVLIAEDVDPVTDELVARTDLRPVWISKEAEVVVDEDGWEEEETEDESYNKISPEEIIDFANKSWGADNWYRVVVLHTTFPQDTLNNPVPTPNSLKALKMHPKNY